MKSRKTMDADTRASAIETIIEYAELGGDLFLLEQVGFGVNRRDVTEDQEFAAIVAVVPLLPDERIDFLMRHIAEMFVVARRKAVTS